MEEKQQGADKSFKRFITLHLRGRSYLKEAWKFQLGVSG